MIDALDLLGCYKRARGVVHGNIARVFAHMLQTGANRILPVFAAGDNRLDLLPILIAHELFQVTMSIFAGDDDDCGNGVRFLKCANCMRNHRFARDRDEKFIRADSPAAAPGDDDGSEHG